MKTKISLFIAAAIVLFSFTVVSKTSTTEVKNSTVATENTENNAPNGGFAIEDQDQWK
jgi:hypothetical protein